MKSWEREQMIREEAIRSGLQEGLQEGLQQGLQQGLNQGELLKVLSLIQKKFIKNVTISDCALMLEEEASFVAEIYQILKNHNDFSLQELFEEYTKNKAAETE